MPNSRGCYRSYQSLLKKYSNNNKQKETLKIDEGVRQTIEKITTQHQQTSSSPSTVNCDLVESSKGRIEAYLDRIIERMDIDDVVKQLDMLDSESLRQFLILLKKNSQQKKIDEVKMSEVVPLDKNNNQEDVNDEHNKQNLIASIKAFLQANVI